MNILEALYKGEVSGADEIVPADREYREISEEIGTERDYFSGKMPEEDKERFERWNRKLIAREDISEYAVFEYAFMLGMRIAVEALTGKVTTRG